MQVIKIINWEKSKFNQPTLSNEVKEDVGQTSFFQTQTKPDIFLLFTKSTTFIFNIRHFHHITGNLEEMSVTDVRAGISLKRIFTNLKNSL
jgi:hypothetical protein